MFRRQFFLDIEFTIRRGSGNLVGARWPAGDPGGDVRLKDDLITLVSSQDLGGKVDLDVLAGAGHIRADRRIFFGLDNPEVRGSDVIRAIQIIENPVPGAAVWPFCHFVDPMHGPIIYWGVGAPVGWRVQRLPAVRLRKAPRLRERDSHFCQLTCAFRDILQRSVIQKFNALQTGPVHISAPNPVPDRIIFRFFRDHFFVDMHQFIPKPRTGDPVLIARPTINTDRVARHPYDRAIVKIDGIRLERRKGQPAQRHGT